MLLVMVLLSLAVLLPTVRVGVDPDEDEKTLPDPRPLMMNPPKPVEVGPVVVGSTSGEELGVPSSSISLCSSAGLLVGLSSVPEDVSSSEVLVECSSVLLLILGTTSDSTVASTVSASPVSVVNFAALRLISVSEPFSVGQNGVCVFVSTTVSSTVTHTSSFSQDTLVDVEVSTVVHAVRTGRAGAQDVMGMELSCSCTVGNVSR